jgi:hypothetical protein
MGRLLAALFRGCAAELLCKLLCKALTPPPRGRS